MLPRDFHERLPAFSVIVPTYNRPAPLTTCLAALAAMDYPRHSLEVIIVDDGGTSDLAPLLDRFDDAINVTTLRQANAGPAAARNAGAAVAGNEFLAFTDDDCTPHRSWLRQLAEVLSAKPDALVGGQSRNALPDNLYAVASHTILDVVNAHYNHDHQRCTFFPSNNMAMRRRNFLEIGGFDPGFRCSEDRDLCDRWSARGLNLIFAPDAVVEHTRAMGLWDFCKQHFGYGRGAWRFHRMRERRGTGELKVEGSFYLKCFRQPFQAHPLGRALPLAALLGVWQLANAAGFFSEAFRPSRARLASRAVASGKPTSSRVLPAARARK